MTKPLPSNLPIGYWLKKVDQLLTDRINQIQAANGVSRLEWQILNTLFEKAGASKEELDAILAPFTDIAALGNILAHFAELNWLDVSNNDEGTIIYHLSSEGKQRHQRVFQAQQAARALAMKGITAEAYAIVIGTLQQMATNLEMIETLADNQS